MTGQLAQPSPTREAQQAAYFEKQTVSNREFWSRFEARPDFAGKRVLEVGSGHGAMGVAVAEAGAAEVLGVDLNEDLVDWARRHLQDTPHADRVRFECVRLEDLPEGEQFDVAISKDTFEHVCDLESMLGGLLRVLKPGAELWAGFSPLYASPFGDHRRAGLKVPWAHVVLPQRAVLAAASHHQGRPVATLEDIGLNGLEPAAFRRAFAASGFEVRSIAYNRGDRRLMRTLGRVRRHARFERVATVGMYCVLRKPA